ncbi:MAG: MFS transporter [Acidobacteria bacterium]|nr:MFS transporter [Acidobacteriota bacterium]
MKRKFEMKNVRWWIVILLTGITTINYLDRQVLSVVGPVLREDLDIKEIQFSRIAMAFQLAYLIMMPISGRIIDWLKLRLGFTLSIISWSIAQMATAFATGWKSFAVYRALLGMTEAGNFPGAAKTVSQWFSPKERTLATGIINMGAGFGAIIATPLVVYILTVSNWKTAFVVTGAFGFVWLGLWLFFYRDPEKHPFISKAELAVINEGQRELLVEERKSGEGVWKIVLYQRNFWAIGIARFFSEPAWQFFTYWIPLYLYTERHMDLKQIGYFAWLPWLAADLGSVFGGALSPFFIGKLKMSVMTARKCSAATAALIMVFAIFIGRAPSPGWAIFFFCVGAFAHQAMSSTLMTLPADLFPKSTVATANGLSGTTAVLGGMFFTAVVGYVAETIGYGPIFIIIAFLDIIGVTFLWWLLRAPKPIEAGRPAEVLETRVRN